MKDLIIKFDSETGELTLQIETDLLIVDKFITGAKGISVRVLSPDEQKKIALKLTNNLLSK